MRRRALALALILALLFSTVAGTQVVKVVKANFVYLPEEPEPIAVSIRLTYDRTYFQDPVTIPFTVKKPAFGSITTIAYSLDGEGFMGNVESAGGEYWVTLKELSEGWHNVTIKVTGTSTYREGYTVKNAWVSDVKWVKFLVDNVPPKISVLSPQNDSYTTTDVPLNFNLSELAEWICYSLDGQTNVTITGNTTLPELSDGSHSLTVYAKDRIGRSGTSETINFAVDTVLPRISLLSPQNKTYYATNITLSFTLEEAVSWIAYSLDGQENVTINGNITLTGLSNSSHSLTVYAKDLAGNTATSETIYFSITQQEPFPTWIGATTVTAAIAVVGAALLIYSVKVKKATGKTE